VVFELKNKIRGNSSYLNSEDVLTGVVFGNLRYFKNRDILINFLNEATDINKKKLRLPDNIKLNVNFWEKHFNDETRKYNETDITLSNEKYMIIIECKYHSQLGEEYEIEEGRVKNYSNQLIRYSKILLDEKYKETEKIVIYLTMDKSIPKDILIKSRNDIDKNIKLYWLSWNKLYLTFSKYNINNLDENEITLFNDLNDFLAKRDLITFGKFITEKISCNYQYKKLYRYAKTNYILNWRYNRPYKYIDNKIVLTWRYKNE
jgi:hypothetical protein